ncbi:hypothetical protein J5690_02205, partial [bacterium]|nr:hypothetical protein [bacterium]
MKKINTLFCVLAILALFVLLTGCGNPKKETETGETADNEAVDADIYDGDEADSEDSEPDEDDGDENADADIISDADSVSDNNDIDCATFNEFCITMDNMWSSRGKPMNYETPVVAALRLLGASDDLVKLGLV